MKNKIKMWLMRRFASDCGTVGHEMLPFKAVRTVVEGEHYAVMHAECRRCGEGGAARVPLLYGED